MVINYRVLPSVDFLGTDIITFYEFSLFTLEFNLFIID